MLNINTVLDWMCGLQIFSPSKGSRKESFLSISSLSCPQMFLGLWHITPVAGLIVTWSPSFISSYKTLLLFFSSLLTPPPVTGLRFLQPPRFQCDLIIAKYTWKDYFQIRSHSKVLGGHEFWRGYCSTHYSVYTFLIHWPFYHNEMSLFVSSNISQNLICMCFISFIKSIKRYSISFHILEEIIICNMGLTYSLKILKELSGKSAYQFVFWITFMTSPMKKFCFVNSLSQSWQFRGTILQCFSMRVLFTFWMGQFFIFQDHPSHNRTITLGH